MESGEAKDIIRLIKSSLTAIDGLWFLEVEKEFGFEKAFEIDLGVWKKYGPVMIKRIMKMLSITDTGLDSFIRVLEVLCEIDGTRFSVKERSESEAVLAIEHCPWHENLKRSKRENLVRCDMVDKTIFPEWTRAFNHALKLELFRSIPEGHGQCLWRIVRS
jgi:hypothetical protein